MNFISNIFIKIKNKGFIKLLSANAFMHFLGFLVQFLIAWILTEEDVGRVKYFQVFILVTSIFSGLGISSSVQKLCSENRDINHKIYIYKLSFNLTLVFAIIFYFFILLLSSFNFFSNDEVTDSLIPLISLAIIPQTIAALLLIYFEARKAINHLSYAQPFAKILSLFIIVILTYLFKLDGYALGFIFGTILTAIIFYFSANNLNKSYNKPESFNPLPEIIKYAKYSYPFSLVNVVNISVDVILINILIKERDVIGYYSFALILLVALNLITTTIQQVITPYFSERADNFNEWFSTFKKYFLAVILFSIPITLISFLVVPELIILIFKDKYLQSTPFFKILVFSWMIRNIYSVMIIAIFGTGKLSYNLISHAVILVLNFIISYYMIIYYGVDGAAYSNLIINFMSLIIVFLSFYLLSKRIRISPNLD